MNNPTLTSLVPSARGRGAAGTEGRRASLYVTSSCCCVVSDVSAPLLVIQLLLRCHRANGFAFDRES